MNFMVKRFKSIPPIWCIIAFFGVIAFTLFMALIPGSADPTAGLINSKVKHIITFFVLALMLDWFAFPTKNFVVWKPLSLLGFGILIEVLQWFTVYRTFSYWDMVADTVGIALYFSVSLIFIKKETLRLSEA